MRPSSAGPPTQRQSRQHAQVNMRPVRSIYIAICWPQTKLELAASLLPCALLVRHSDSAEERNTAALVSTQLQAMVYPIKPSTSASSTHHMVEASCRFPLLAFIAVTATVVTSILAQ